MGYPVLGEDGVIEIEKEGEVTISEQGELLINGIQTNRFLIEDFEQPEFLKKVGNSLFIPEKEEIREKPIEQICIKQGYLEQSNVNPIEEMVEMLMTLRRFEAIQKSIKLQNETIGKAANELGRGK